MLNKFYNERKSPRLLGYDYSQNGFYFVTICTEYRKNILSKIVENRIFLSNIGFIVKNVTEQIHIKYPTVNVIKYVIMPNHIHLLMSLNARNEIREISPEISAVMGWYKFSITKEVNKFSNNKSKIFQRSFNDHIIRNDREFFEYKKYIENNPLNWKNDDFFRE